MRIGIDGYNLALRKGTGIATYGRELASTTRLLGHESGILWGETLENRTPEAVGEESPDNVGGLFAKSSRTLRQIAGAVHIALGPTATRIPSDDPGLFRYRLPNVDEIWSVPNLYRHAVGTFRRLGAFSSVTVPQLDLMHWTYPLPIRVRNAPNVYTIHDLIPLRVPHATLDNKARFYDLCRRLVKQADHIITVSESSRQDIINLLGAPPEKVTNTYQYVESSEASTIADVSDRQKILEEHFNLDFKGYFLFVGAIEPKKNVARLIQAHAASETRTPLVIVGKAGWSADVEMRILEASKDNPEPGPLRWLEYLPREMLVTVIAGAKALVFPSLYEGFGLPVLEAMSLGTAVITSNLSSLPEIAGDAAILVDPYDIGAIASAMREVDCNTYLRTELENKGRRRAGRFSREAYSGKLAGIYRSITDARAKK